MKKLILTSVAALAAVVATERPAAAWTKVDFGIGFNLCVESTGRTRCFTYTSCSNPPPCGYCCGGGCGPAPFDALAAYGAVPPAGYPAPAAVAPAPAGGYVAPAPTPAPANQSGTRGAQQAGYFTLTGYGNANGYGYGYGYAGTYGGNFQAPSYWYGN
jgi:hypothetical protein